MFQNNYQMEMKVGSASDMSDLKSICLMFQLRKCPVIFTGFSQFWPEQIDTKSTTRPFKSIQPKQFKEILQIYIIFRCLFENKCYIT